MKKSKKKNFIFNVIVFLVILIYAVFGTDLIKDIEKNVASMSKLVKDEEKVEVDLNSNLSVHFIDQTCPIMIQRLNNIFQRKPLISMGI